MKEPEKERNEIGNRTDANLQQTKSRTGCVERVKKRA